MDASEKMIVNDFCNELLAAEYILNTEYSFELAEPSYLKCLGIIEAYPSLQVYFEKSLIDLFLSQKVSDEPVAYLMHKLRWPTMKKWVENELKRIENPMACGASLDKILDAYSDNWGNRIFYDSV